MPEITREEAIAELERRQSTGEHIDDRLWNEVRAPGRMFLRKFECVDDFLNLIWQETDPVRLLTPRGQPRTLRDVASRMIESGRSFANLAASLELPRTEHHPEWFAPCVEIDRDFDFDRFGWIVLTPAQPAERSQSPRGTYYVYDGVHKTLVLAKRLLADGLRYETVTGLLLTPRRA